MTARMLSRPAEAADDNFGQYAAWLFQIQNADAERFQATQKASAERQEFIHKMIGEHQQLLTMFENMKFDFESLQIANRNLVKAQESAAQTIEHQKSIIKEFEYDKNSNPLVGVFVDGDGANFKETLIKDGISGGEEAAHMFQHSIRTHLREIYPSISVAIWKIMVIVVASIDNLGNAYQDSLAQEEEFSGINWPIAVRQFAIGFNRGTHHTFSFVDIGSEESLQELTDTKLKEIFTMILPHCKHAFFAGCHDSRYVSFLRPYKDDQKVAGKVTLVETDNTDSNYYGLGLKMASFPDVFRSKDFIPSDDRSRITSLSVSPEPPSNNDTQDESVPSTPQISSPCAASSATNDTRPDSAGQSESALEASPETFACSWSMVTKADVTDKMIDIAPSKKSASKLWITLNRDNERVDSQLAPTTKAAEQSFAAKIEKQGQNFCNRCNLPGTGSLDACEWTNPRYKHGRADLTQDELLVLRHKVRNRPCVNGAGCRDFICAYGHHCRAGKICTRICCSFADTHHMDIRPYKKLYENGSEQN